jgi:hypothetical protein
MIMKTNEMSQQEMLQTNGGGAMPPMPGNSGAGDLTIKQIDPQTPAEDPATAADAGGLQPTIFGTDMFGDVR